jgi:hypothetical protein
MQQNFLLKTPKKYIMALLFFCLFVYIYPQSEIKAFVLPETLPENTKFQIAAVEYDIKGLTMEASLRRAVQIDTKTQFASSTQFFEYIKKLEKEFKNIRTLESVQLEPLYTNPNGQNLSLVTLIVHTKDTFNFIAMPYPKYDSNSGTSLKLKIKDNNFLGTMQPLNFDLNWQNGVSRSIAANCDFVYPYDAGPLRASQAFETGFELDIDQPHKLNFNFGTTSAFSYSYKFLTLVFGLSQSFEVNPDFGAAIGKKGYRYYLQTKSFVSLPMTITQVGDFGFLVYVPHFSLSKKWAFSTEANKAMKGVQITVGHSLGFGKVEWKKNFREGLEFQITNDYSFDTSKKSKPDISFETTLKGYISFFNRIGIYSRVNFFYNLNKVQSNTAGKNLRGILDRRLNTDIALSWNIDLPIKIFSTSLEQTTDRKWTRFFDFELHAVPFLDFAFVHDFNSNRYFSPKDVWCSGGLELIIFPVKFRSIYVRASFGFDLRELKNVPGLIKLEGIATRDGERMSEVFLGIGLHY